MSTLESIHANIAKLQAQAAALAAKNSTAILERIRRLMDKHGVTVADIEAHVGKGRGRKLKSNGTGALVVSAAKYVDPKTGATWTGRGRAPAWIASVRDRTKFLIAGGAANSAVATKSAPKAGNYVRGPQPALYRDPKTGATWSGRGPAPAWLAGAKDRSKFLIANAAKPAAAPKAKVAKAVTAKKTVSKRAEAKATTTKKAPAKKATAKKVSAPAGKTARKNGAAVKVPVARKARVAKSAAKATAPVDAAVNQAPTEIASTPAAD